MRATAAIIVTMQWSIYANLILNSFNHNSNATRDEMHCKHLFSDTCSDCDYDYVWIDRA